MKCGVGNSDCGMRDGSANQLRELPAEAGQSLWFFGLTFPDHNRAPAEFVQSALMQLVARGVAIEFFQPPFAPVRGRSAVLAAAMPMPETTVDKNGNALFYQNNVRSDEAVLRWLSRLRCVPTRRGVDG